jgi:hypothetical protein
MRCTLISVAVFRSFSNNAQAVQLVISALEFSDRSLYALEESLANWGLSLRPLQMGLLAPWHFLARDRCRSVIKASNFSDCGA